MRIALLSAAAIILISGCAGRPHPVDTVSTSTSQNSQTTASNREATSDSTMIRDRVSFHPVAVAADSAKADLQLEQTSDGRIKPVSYETHGKGGASAQVHVTADGKARIMCRCDAWRDSVATLERTVTRLRREKSARDSVVYRDRWRVRTVVNHRSVPRPVAWYDYAARGLAVIVLIGLLLVLVLIMSYHRHHKQSNADDDDTTF